jgi:hypothetical protein
MILTGSLVVTGDDLAAASKARKRQEPILLPVVFPTSFAAPPAIMLGLTAFTGGGEPFEFAFHAENVTASGFDLALTARRSWIDTFTVGWTAIEA